jgi:hypothetical protein
VYVTRSSLLYQRFQPSSSSDFKQRGGKAGGKGAPKPGDDRDDPNQKKLTMQETFTKRATGNAGFEAYYKVRAQAGRSPCCTLLIRDGPLVGARFHSGE